MVVCPNCGNQAGEGAVFCDQCGTRLPTAEPAAPAVVAEVAPEAPESPQPTPTPVAASVICSACGAGNVPGELFCDFCGSPLEAPEPVAEAAPETAAPEAAAAEAGPTCPACGAPVKADEAFCADCGASLAQPPIPPEPVIEPEDEAEAEVPPELDAELQAELDAEIEAAMAEAEAPAEEAQAAPAAVVEPVVEPSTLVVEVEPGPPTCPACGELVEGGDKFCSNCGAVLAAQPAAPQPASAVAPAVPAVGPRLVVQDTGAEIPVPGLAEVLIGREDPVSGIFPDVDLTPHGGEAGGVSRRHARLIFESGSYAIEDLDSTNYTFVNKQKLAARTRHPLQDGDEIRCGRVALILKL